MGVLNFKKIVNEAGSHSDVIRELTADELKQLKDTLLEMFLEIVRVCEANGICLMLAGGSVLGAVRHQGFIPWDDDLDLMMTREDFRKLCAVFERELGEKYLLVAPNHGKLYQTRFPKIMKRNTVLRTVTDVDSPLPCGIFLDIFILDHIPANRFLRFCKGFWCNTLMFIGSRVYLYEHDNPIFHAYMSGSAATRKALDKALKFGRFFSLISSRKWSDLIDRSVQYRKATGYLGLPTGRKHYFGEIFPDNVFLPPSRGTFEGHEVLLPADCDSYLRNLYGDYMQIPPEEKREKHHIIELRF